MKKVSNNASITMQQRTSRKERTWARGLLLLLAVILSFAAMPARAAGVTQLIIDGTTYSTPSADPSGSGWTWNDTGNTLTLTNYTGGAIHINNSGVPVSLVISGTNTVTTASGHGIIATGPLTITDGGSGSLTVTTGTGSSAGIYVLGNLTISSGTVTANVSGASSAIHVSGNLTIDGSATVTADATGTSSGLYIPAGNLIINTTGTVNVTAVSALTLSTYSGASIQNGTVTVSGNVDGDLTVSGGTVNVTGNISSDLTVSAGTVTVPGTVAGSTTFTGGTLKGGVA